MKKNFAKLFKLFNKKVDFGVPGFLKKFTRKSTFSIRYASFFAAGVLMILPAVIYILNRPQEVEAEWWNEKWLYRKVIAVSSGTSAVSGYQVKVQTGTSTLISAGKLRSDCGDLRFTSYDGTELPHWIEESGGNACNDTDTNIWVRVDNVPASGGVNIYMYYGNASAENKADGNKVFEFFDDFNAAALDTMKWTLSVSSGTYTVTQSGGKVTLSTSTASSAAYLVNLLPITDKTEKFEVIRKINVTGSTGTNIRNRYSLCADIALSSCGGSPGDYGLYSTTTGPQPQVYWNGGWTTTAVTTSDEIRMTHRYDGTNLYWDITNMTTGSSIYSNTYATSALNQNYIRTGATLDGGATGTSQTAMDWVFLKRYIATEPAAGSPGSEEQGNGPIAYWDFNEGYGTTVHNKMEEVGESGLLNWWKMDEGADNLCSGGSNDVCDSMGRNDGAGTNLTWSTSGKIGSTSSYNGSSTTVSVGSISGLSTPFSFSGWVYVDSVATTRPIFATNSEATNYYGYWANIDATTGYLNLHYGDGTGAGSTSRRSIYGPTTIATSTWTHVAGVVRGPTDMSLYVNGVNAGATYSGTGGALSTAAGTGYIGFNSNGSNGDGYYDGYIDNLKFYSKALTQSEVLADYHSKQGMMINMSPSTDWVDGVVPISGQGPMGKALDFDGSDDYVEVPDLDQLDFGSNQDFTISLWLNSTQAPATNLYPLLVNKLQTSPDTYYAIILHSSNNFDGKWMTMITYAGNQTLALGTKDLADGNWHHIAMTRNGSTLTLYEEGEYADSEVTVTSDLSNTGTFNIGEDYAGKIDDLKVYRYALSADEIKKEYNQGAAATLGQNQKPNIGNAPKGFWKFDEGSGYSAFDSSGNNYTGVLTSMTEAYDWVPGRIGRALDFDGTDDYVLLNYESNFDFERTQAMSFAAWVKTTGTGNQAIFSKLVHGSNYEGYEFNLSAGLVRLLLINQASTNRLEARSTVTVNDGSWHHVATTYDGSSTPGGIKIYVDGIGVGMTNPYNSLSASILNNIVPKIGTRNGNEYFSGKIDHVKVYNYVRTPEQIHQDMATGSPVAYWNFDEGTSTTAHNVQRQNGETGLVAWWKMDESAANSCSGGVNDSCDTMMRNDGAWNGNATTTTTSRIGRAVTFDGTGDYIDAGSTTSMANKSITVSAWVKRGAAGANHCILGQGTSGTQHNSFHFGFRDTNVLTCDFYSNGLDTTSTYTDTTNWHHYVCTYDSVTKYRAIYVDGVLVTSNTATANFQGSGNLIIGRTGLSSWDFNGQIDNLKVYERALPADDVAEEYATSNLSMQNMDPSTDWVDGAIPTTGQKPMGKAVDFDGSNDYLIVSDSSTLDITGPVSLSAWVKPTTLNSYNIVLAKRAATNNHNYLLSVEGTNAFRISYYTTVYNSYTSTTTPVVTSQWQHLAATYDGSGTTKLYYNGVLQPGSCGTGTCTGGVTPNNDSLAIGRAGDYDGNYFTGQIDEVKIYNYELSESEVLNEYNGGAPLKLGAGKNDSDSAGGSLVGWWKFDEGSGYTAFDISGDNNTGILTNMDSGTDWIPGYVGKALDFDGSNDYVRVNDPGTSTLDITGSLTVSAWVKWDQLKDYGVILNKGTGGSAQNFNYAMWSYASKHVSGYIGNTSSANVVSSTTHFLDRRWYNVTMTVDGSNLIMYVDGVRDNSSSQTVTPAANNNPLVIGGDTGLVLDGQVDNVKVWSKALSPAEIAWEVNQGKPIYHWSFDQKDEIIAKNNAGKAVSNDGLVGFWTMDSTTINDMSGNGNNLTNSGSPTSASGEKNNAVDYLASSAQYSYCTDANCGADLDYQGNGFTASAWFIADSAIGGAYRHVLSKGFWTSSTSNGGYTIDVVATTGEIRGVIFNSNGTTNYANGTTGVTMSTTAWQNVIMTYDGSAFYVYVDGVQKNKIAYSGGIMNVTQDFLIGGWPGTGGDWDGKIDHVKIWQRALSENEVQTEYAYNEKYGYLTNMDASTDWVAGNVNGAVEFDGTDEKIETGITTQNVAVSATAWIKADATSGTYYIVNQARDYYGSGWSMAIASNNLKCYYNLDSADDAHEIEISTSFTDTTNWHHVGCTYDGTTANLYLDGKPLATSSTAGSITYKYSEDIVIGEMSYASDYHNFDGKVDEVKVYNYGLTADQILTDYNNSSAVRFD